MLSGGRPSWASSFSGLDDGPDQLSRHMLMGYFGLCLADSLGRVDAVALVREHGAALSWACGGVTLAGFVIQFIMDRWRIRRDRWRLDRYPYSHRRLRGYDHPGGGTGAWACTGPG